MKLLDKKAEQEIIDRVKTVYEYIPHVVAGKCRFNFQCFDNAVHEAYENSWDKVALVVYIANKCPIIHCININEKGEFVDNTLGHICREKEYYFVRYIMEEEFPDRWMICKGLRKELRRNLNWWTRLLSEHGG